MPIKDLFRVGPDPKDQRIAELEEALAKAGGDLAEAAKALRHLETQLDRGRREYRDLKRRYEEARNQSAISNAVSSASAANHTHTLAAFDAAASPTKADTVRAACAWCGKRANCIRHQVFWAETSRKRSMPFCAIKCRNDFEQDQLTFKADLDAAKASLLGGA